MVVGLLDEPYCLSMADVADLTVRQITFLYYRERDKQGRPRPLPYYFVDEAEKRNGIREQFRMMGATLGKTPEEIEQILEEAERNGRF